MASRMLLALLWVLHWLPLSVQAFIGRGFGALLHALVGYDAQPSGAQLAAYLGVLALIVMGTRLAAQAAAARPALASRA